MSTTTQSARRRLSVITIDQMIAGASNVLIAILAARVLGVASFGLFGIVFLVYAMAVGVTRALVNDPVLVHPLEAEERLGEVIGTSILLGIGVAVVVAAAGLGIGMWDPRLGNALVVLALCLPLLVLQDLGRYVGFATQKPSAALVLDVTWLVLLLGAVAALFATGTHMLAWFIAAWGGSGALAGVLLFAQHSARGVRFGLSWLRYTWSFSWRYLISYTSTQGAALGMSSGVGAIAGARALGGVQGAVLLVRPFMTFQVAAIAASIGEIARSLSIDTQPRRLAVRTSLLATAVALLNAVVLLVLPDRIGEVVLGASWHVAKPLLLPTGVQIVCLGSLTGVRAGLLGMRAIRKAMVLDVVGTVVVLAAASTGAVIDGAVGALWAVAAGWGLMAVLWWVTFLGHTAHPRPAASEVATASLPPAAVPSPPV